MPADPMRVEVECGSYREGLNLTASDRAGRGVVTATATATGRSALLLALGEAVLREENAHSGPAGLRDLEECVAADKAVKAALAALREWGDYKGGTGGKPYVDGGGDDDK